MENIKLVGKHFTFIHSAHPKYIYIRDMRKYKHFVQVKLLAQHSIRMSAIKASGFFVSYKTLEYNLKGKVL